MRNTWIYVHYDVSKRGKLCRVMPADKQYENWAFVHKSRNAGCCYYEWKMIDAVINKNEQLARVYIENWCLFANGDTPQELIQEFMELPFSLLIMEEIGVIHQELWQGSGTKKMLKETWQPISE